MSGRPVRVFCSYSHKDQQLLEQLEIHLSLLKRQGIVETWTALRILPGAEWNDKIHTELHRADIILLLVSADFLASDYCYDIEVMQALEKHESGEARVIPIILRPCDWHSSPFGKLQALPKDSMPITSWDDHDQAWVDVARGIRRAV